MKLEIKIPTKLNEITLRQYKKFLKAKEQIKEEVLINAKMIEIFCNVKMQDVMLLKVSDSAEIVKILSKLFDQKPSLVKKFKIGKQEFGFIPQLDEMSLGEYIDLDNFIGDWENMDKAMNVLYRPVLTKLKDKYSIEDYEVGTEDRIMDMPMDAVLSAIFFLWNLGLELSQTMTNYLDTKQEADLTQYLNSQANGVGINQFTDSLKEILQELNISLN
jgi:hypothetical protein